MAVKYSSWTSYSYSFNNPVYWNDPSGADSYMTVEEVKALFARWDRIYPVQNRHRDYELGPGGWSPKTVFMYGKVMNPRNLWGQREWGGSELQLYQYHRDVEASMSLRWNKYGGDEISREKWLKLGGNEDVYADHYYPGAWELVPVNANRCGCGKLQAGMSTEDLRNYLDNFLYMLESGVESYDKKFRADARNPKLPKAERRIARMSYKGARSGKYIGTGRLLRGFGGAGVLVSGWDAIEKNNAGNWIQVGAEATMLILCPACLGGYALLDMGLEYVTGRDTGDWVQVGIDSLNE